MLNAKRIFFIIVSNVGVRLFRLGIYSTSNTQRASAARGFERVHAQKHPTTNGHESTLIKTERTTNPTDWGAHEARVRVSAASPKQSSADSKFLRFHPLTLQPVNGSTSHEMTNQLDAELRRPDKDTVGRRKMIRLFLIGMLFGVMITAAFTYAFAIPANSDYWRWEIWKRGGGAWTMDKNGHPGWKWIVEPLSETPTKKPVVAPPSAIKVRTEQL